MSFKPSRASYSVLPGSRLAPGGDPLAPDAWTLSMQMDQVNDNINFGNVLDQDGTTAFSFTAYLKSNWTSGTHIIWSNLNGSNRGIEVNINGGTRRVTLIMINTVSSNWLNVEFQTQLTNNAWNQIVVTHDGSRTAAGTQGYINSALSAKTVSGNNLTATTLSGANMYFNARNGSLFGSNPQLYKEVGYYFGVWGQSDVNEIWNGGSPIDLTAITNPPSHLWRCGDTPGDDFTATTGQIQDTGSIGGLTGTPTNTLGGFVTDVP